MKPYTQLIYHDSTVEDYYKANSAPIYQTATFAHDSVQNLSEYDYSRSCNPTRTLAAEKIAQLEKGKYGFLFNSGMAAITTCFNLLEPGSHVIVGDDIYGGTHRLLSHRLQQRGISVSYVDTTDLINIEKACNKTTKLLLLETPSNPLQKITDLKAVSAFCRTKNIIFVIDNTLLSPWLQQPLTLGADIVLHSATKYLSGHSNVTAGAVIVNDDELAKKIAFMQNAEGNALAPFESWLLQHNLKTLGLRVERQQANALKIVEFLQLHPKIKQIYYAGLKDHPGYELNQRQSRGPGSIISFTTNDLAFSEKLANDTRLFTISVSFGSLNSLISLPYFMSHASIPAGQRNLPRDLVRMSIGIEDPGDLIKDLELVV